MSTLLLELKIQELQQLLELLMEEKIRRSLKEPVQATRTKNRNEAGGEGEGEGEGEEETLGRLRVTLTANVRFKLRVSQNRK